MAPNKKVSSSRFQVDLQQSHFSILNSTSNRLRQANPTPLDLRSSSRPKSTYWGRLPGLYIHTYIHTCINTYIRTYVRTYVLTYMYVYVHTCTYVHVRTYMYVRTCIHT